MIPYILTNKSSFPSARILRTALQEETGKKILITGDENKYKYPPTIRYGNSHGMWSNDGSINSAQFIKMISNKRRFSELLIEKGLSAPRFFKSTSSLEEKIFPVLIRTSLYLSGGKGIIFCRDEKEFSKNWNSNYCWTQFIPLQWEVRVHMLGGKVSRIFRKTWEGENREPEFPIRNNNSYAFRLKNIDAYEKLVKLIPTLNSIFGIDGFYALDIGWDTVNKKYFFIEGNTAPGLNENTAKEYANFILGKISL